jgi:glutaminase
MPSQDDLPVARRLRAIFEKVATSTDGTVADYIPALAEANPDWFGVSLTTVDGHRYDLGDSDVRFTIQSISKPFVFGLALDEYGVEGVQHRVGVEPSGDPFNAIEVDVESGRPYNPMVNTGAILTTSLVPGGLAQIRDGLSRFAGRTLPLDERVLESERSTGDRNRAIAYLMRNFGMLEGDVDECLEAYFSQCSLEVDAADLATMSATLANGGVNPLSARRVMREQHVPQVLSVMSTCGMYDYAGEWGYRVGLPAKSGVSGAVLAVLPGQFGLAVFSPPLDKHGNSVRGIDFCTALSEQFGLHQFTLPSSGSPVVRRSYSGAAVRSMMIRDATEDALLSEHGHLIRVIEVQGDLRRFATAEAMGRAVVEQFTEGAIVILDLSRSARFDGRVQQLIADLVEVAERAGAVLVAAERSVDGALEWSENELLERLLDSPEPHLVDLGQCALLAGMSPETVADIESSGERVGYDDGAVLFRAGDPADRIAFVLSGSVDIRGAGGPSGRIAAEGPGAAVGELATLFDTPRTATVVAGPETLCVEISTDALEAVFARHPKDQVAFYANLARVLASRLRRNSAALEALS